MEKVGFIGLGRMGRPMASNLCRKGFRLTVNDINPAAVAELELLQAGSAATVAEVAQKSDIIVTMLPNSAVVDDVVSRADGIIASARPGALILDMSTIDPGTTDRLAKAAAAKGIAFVDAPVGRLASHAGVALEAPASHRAPATPRSASRRAWSRGRRRARAPRVGRRGAAARPSGRCPCR